MMIMMMIMGNNNKDDDDTLTPITIMVGNNINNDILEMEIIMK